MSLLPYKLAIYGIARNSLRQTLVVRRSCHSKHWPGYWDLPGGKVDPSETVDAALRREFIEETGLKVEVNRMAAITEFALSDIRVACIIAEVSVISGHMKLSGEHDLFRWSKAGDIPRLNICPYLQNVFHSIIYAQST